MRYIQRLNKDVNKDNEIYTKAKQRVEGIFNIYFHVYRFKETNVTKK